MNVQQPIRVLLVEDSDHDQIAFGRALDKSRIPFEVTVCGRAEDIPAAMQEGSDAFDVVVVDHNLPGLNGLEAYKNLSRKTELPPFIMLTGTGSEYLAVDALQAGMYDYIIKDPNQGYLKLLPLKLVDVRQRHHDRKARLKAKADLKEAHAGLGKLVKKRTAELDRTVETLKEEIAERMNTEEALRASEKTLRYLSLKVIESQENERKQIAKELHDSIGSSLAAIKFALEEKLLTMRDGPPDDIISLEKIVGYIHDTIKEVRMISMSLRPSMLDDFGLLKTIDWYCRSRGELYKDTRIDTRFDPEVDNIPEFSKVVVYRVLQEALNNALKHSEAQTIMVRLEKEGRCVRMCVSDDGNGFEPTAELNTSDPLTGYGLRSMYDRAEIVGGTLIIDSTPGKGTDVCLELPCEVDELK